MEKIIPDTNRKYSISDKGVVKNLKTNRILVPHDNLCSKSDKLSIGVALIDKGKPNFIKLNTLMIKTFKLKPPDKYHKYILVHRDNNPWNNNLSNFEWKIFQLSKINKFYPQPFYNEKGKIISKICDKCGENKSISNFLFQNNRDRYNKTYRNSCTQCISKLNFKRILDCPEKKAEYLKRSKELYTTPKVKEWYKNYWKKYSSSIKGSIICKKSRLKNKELLSDGYIKSLLSEPVVLKNKDIPQYLIDLKRTEIKLKKKLDYEKQQKILQSN